MIRRKELFRRGESSRRYRRRVFKRAIRWILIRLRVLKFRVISDHKLLGAHIVTPTLAIGRGHISADGAQFGFWPSPHAFATVIHLEARTKQGRISIGQGTIINNASVLISTGAGVEIGERVLIGPGVQIYDSDFHSADPSQRHSEIRSGKVIIGDDVFIGAGAIILRGSIVGNGATIGAGTVVRGKVQPSSVFLGS